MKYRPQTVVILTFGQASIDFAAGYRISKLSWGPEDTWLIPSAPHEVIQIHTPQGEHTWDGDSYEVIAQDWVVLEND